MTNIRRFIKNRFVIGTVLIAIVLLLAAFLLTVFSMQGKPVRMFPFTEYSIETLGEDEVIKGWVNFDKDSYVIGEIAMLQLRLVWHADKVSPDLDTFKNGIGFFPFNRRESFEQHYVIEGDINEFLLVFSLQAVDVEPASSYMLAPPTIYYTTVDNSKGDLLAYRITAPQVHIGGYYPAKVATIPMLDIKGEIADPMQLRQGIMTVFGGLLVFLAATMIWYFGRVRRVEILSESEKLWREYQGLKNKTLDNRDYLVECESIFTNLLQSQIDMSPVTFWSGRDPEDGFWKDNVNKAREIFYLSYLFDEPDSSAVSDINKLLEHLFSNLVEEERLKTEQVPSFRLRLIQQPEVLSCCGVLIIFAVLVFIIAARPLAWSPADVVEYNSTLRFLLGDESVESKYEQISSLVDRIDDENIKAAALYNAGTFATTPELTGQDIYQQEALLEVMFQDQRVFLDALLHSMNMEDPFLLVAMIRDSIRFMTQGEAALKAAVRITPDDEAIRRNLELIQKRRQAYAETIMELLQEGEEDSGMGELQRQSLMDLEQFMQMEMPDEFAELEEGKDDKDYFILEGF